MHVVVLPLACAAGAANGIASAIMATVVMPNSFRMDPSLGLGSVRTLA